MSLLLVLYLAGSGLAIGLLALLMHRLGQSETFRFDDETAVREAFSAEFPELTPVEIDVGMAGRAAIAMMDDGRHIGLARAMGRFALARLCTADDILAVDIQGSKLRLHLRDYADPAFVIELADNQRAVQWGERIQPQRVPSAPAVARTQ